MPACIFIVEDDPLMADFLADSLGQLGYDTAQARDGEEALEQMRAGADPPALALIDLIMPDMGGWELIRLMRGDQRLQTVPILICTAQREMRVPADLVNAVLYKPFALEDLERLVSQALKAR